MAPEQASGNNAELTSATDIYGLGAVFYQLLTGSPPFLGRTAYETVRLVLETDPRQPRLVKSEGRSRPFHDLSEVSGERSPAPLLFRARAVAEDLERWLRHEPIQARRTGFVTPRKKMAPTQSEPRPFAVASLAGLIVAMSVIIWKSDFVHPPPSYRHRGLAV